MSSVRDGSCPQFLPRSGPDLYRIYCPVKYFFINTLLIAPITTPVPDLRKNKEVGLIEALSSPSKRASRALEMAPTWSRQAVGEPLQSQGCRTARQLRQPEIDALVAAYGAGGTVHELAVEFGIHRVTVGQHLRALGVDTTPPGLNPDDVPMAVELYQSGWSLVRIAEKYDTSSNTVSKRLREVGVMMRRPWEHTGCQGTT